MNLRRCGTVWLVLPAALCVALPESAPAQVYAPHTNGGTATSSWAPMTPLAGPSLGRGNPFLGTRLMVEPSMIAPQPSMRYDNQVAPASYEQPLANVAPQQPMTNAAPQQPISQPPLPPSYAAQPAMPSIAVPPTAPPPQEFLPPADAAPLAPPQQLRGLALLTAAAPNEHPLMPVLRWVDDALQQMQGLGDYHCTFTKRERVDGRLQEQEVMYAKVRHQPYSVYLQFLAPNEKKGQEAIYVDGRNQGRLLAHPVGWQQAIVGTLALAPNDPKAMEGNLHPITDFGLRRLLERYREGAMRDAQFGECDVRIVPGAQVGDRACTCIEVSHPVRRAEFRYHLTRLYVDNELNLPVHYESYDWPAQQGAQPQLLEDYTYQGLRFNIGLSDADFDVKNPNYRF